MSLSPELRNRIYALALRPEHDGEGGIPGTRAIRISRPYAAGEKPYYVHGDKLYAGAPSNGSALFTAWAQQPALTRVSKHIRRETLPVYYGANLFVILIKSQWSPPTIDRKIWLYTHGAKNWLKAVGSSNIALIKDVEVCLDQAAYLDDERLPHDMKNVETTMLPQLFADKPDVRVMCLVNDSDSTRVEAYWVPARDPAFVLPRRGAKVELGVAKEESMAFRRR